MKRSPGVSVTGPVGAFTNPPGPRLWKTCDFVVARSLKAPHNTIRGFPSLVFARSSAGLGKSSDWNHLDGYLTCLDDSKPMFLLTMSFL